MMIPLSFSPSTVNPLKECTILMTDFRYLKVIEPALASYFRPDIRFYFGKYFVKELEIHEGIASEEQLATVLNEQHRKGMMLVGGIQKATQGVLQNVLQLVFFRIHHMPLKNVPNYVVKRITVRKFES